MLPFQKKKMPQINNLSSYFKKLEKEEQVKYKASRNKQINKSNSEN